MELKLWREPFTINMAKQACRHNNRDKCSVAILASGGLLDTLAAIRAGLTPIWGSEIDLVQRKMWEDLIGTKCHGDAFAIDYRSLTRPIIMKSGFPCPDYCHLGSEKGEFGKSGDLYDL